MVACGHCRRTSAKSYNEITIYLSSTLTKRNVYSSVYVLPSNIDPVCKYSRRYLIKEGVISSFDSSSVSLSTNMCFHNRLYVVSTQLTPLDDPDPDLDRGRKIGSLTDHMSMFNCSLKRKGLKPY